VKKTALSLVFLCFLTIVFAAGVSAGEVMDRIIKNGELVVGTSASQPPMSATSKAGQIIGVDADLSRSIAEAMGVKVKFVTMPFNQLLPALEKGKVDMVISGMTMTPQRNLKVAFVGPYFVSGKGILTKAENIANVKDAGGFNKPTITLAALKGSTSEKFIKKFAPEAKRVTTASYDEAIEQLAQNKIDGLIADYPFCAVAAFRYADKGLRAGESKLTFEPLGIAVREDTLLINWLINHLLTLEGSGVMQRMREFWFQNPSWIKELR
jgi:polar amino acid transport system substrate-binding protein